jgi:hypothetical protein
MKCTVYALKISVMGNKLPKYIFTENSGPLKILTRYNTSRKVGSKLHSLPTQKYFIEVPLVVLEN